MAKSSGSNKETLPEFQKFLLDRRLAPEKNILFFAYWVSRFLDYTRKHELTATEYQEPAVMEFLDSLQSSKISIDPRSGKAGRHHISDKTFQEAVKNALQKAGIPKHASVHTLRHSFATHLLQNGINIREVQSLLGHKNVETTMIYTHVLRDMKNAPQSPLDVLYGDKK